MKLSELYDYIMSGSVNPVILSQMLGKPENIDEILEYVMHTPWNTNPAILAQLTGLSDEDEKEEESPIVGKGVVGSMKVGEISAEEIR